jgi:hypothetical protein
MLALALLTGAAMAGPNLDRIKKQVVGSDAFKKHIDQALPVFCKGTTKLDACRGFVEDAVFCLDFAKNAEKFDGVEGSEEETKHCEEIDKNMPNLSLLSLIISDPGHYRHQSAFLQQTSRVETWARSVVATSPKRKHLPKIASIQTNKVVHKQRKAPEDELAKEMTHDLEMNFNKIAPFGKEDTAKELQDHAAKTQDTLVDAVENAEVAEIKRAVFRALTRLRAATIKEFDTIARLETQAIDAYNDAHHYRAENPLTHLHEDEAPVETDKLKSFH